MPPTETIASPAESTAVRAVSAILQAFDLDPAARMRVLRITAESVPTDASEDAAFEAVRLRSVGADDELRNAEGGGLSAEEFARGLGLKAVETIRTYREQGEIFAWQKDRRNYRYPAWQIHRGALLPGLREVLAILREKHIDPLETVAFFISESEELNEESPLQLLRSKDVKPVIEYAHRYGELGA